MTPTARTLAYLRRLGHTAEVVERFNWHTKRRHDLWGFVDVVSVNGSKVCGWQATSGSNAAARVEKIRQSPLFPAVAQAMSIFVIAWAKRGPRGKRKTWEARIIPVTIEPAKDAA